MKFFTFALPLLFAANALAAPAPSADIDIVAREEPRALDTIYTGEVNKREPEEVDTRGLGDGRFLKINGSLLDSLLGTLNSLLNNITNLLSGSQVNSPDTASQVLQSLLGTANGLGIKIGSRATTGGLLDLIDAIIALIAGKLPEAQPASAKLHEVIVELRAIAAKKKV
ncbi:hypothetical protein B0T10DRAFT_463057 [Thelonectria olida]|uniref:Uncharacterized protein n=1 Tax=Thelonectria olida TaxID=1576542 RepID=A0A9P8W0K9_9HYPO|nr:hypothetical protein B0T10DRAFT_463057 [Thelonectria olida]